MRPFIIVFALLFISLKCFSQKNDTVEKITEKMKGFWLSTDKSSSHWDSLYFGDNGHFYAAQYHLYNNDTANDYGHHVGRWWVTPSVSGGFFLEVHCASMEHGGNFAHYETKLIFNKPFFFWGEQWHKLR